MKNTAPFSPVCALALVLILFQSCVGSGLDLNLPIWGVWNPGEKSDGPFRNVETGLGLFKSPSDNPLVIEPRTDFGPSLTVQGQRLTITGIDGKYPEFLVQVRVYLGDENQVGTLGLRLIDQDHLEVKKVEGDFDVLHTGSRVFTRAEKLETPIDETEYHTGL